MITYSGDVPCEDFSDFRRIDFKFCGRDAVLVSPDEAIATPKWLLKTEYFGAYPAVEVAMLKRGWHVAYLKNINRWGLDKDLDDKRAFADYMHERHGLHTQCVPVGLSAGGLHAIKLAAKYPEIISALYIDAPVINLLSILNLSGSCPGNENLRQEVLDSLNLTLSQLISYREHPLDKLPALVANKIPVILVYGAIDRVCPFHEHGALLVKAYEDQGIPFEVHAKEDCDHHPHGLDDPAPIINFILQHAERRITNG